MATTGTVSNSDYRFIKLKKAGQSRSRWLGKRPIVRGVAMDPVDHPHGGGEGKTSGGRPSVTPWGKPTKGLKTRRSKLSTNMSRSKWKTPFIEKSLFKNSGIKKQNLFWSRRSTIYPAAVRLKLMVHTGKDILGNKFGEFVPSRKKFIPKQKRIVTIKHKK